MKKIKQLGVIVREQGGGNSILILEGVREGVSRTWHLSQGLNDGRGQSGGD